MCYTILFEDKLMSGMSEKLIPNLMKIAGKEQHTHVLQLLYLYLIQDANQIKNVG